jgi:hypothetical protein
MSTGWDPASPYPPNPPYPPYTEAATYAYEQARTRVNLPGILLMLVGMINLLLSLYLVLNGVSIWANPRAEADIQKALDNALQQNPNAFGGAPPTAEQLKTLILGVCLGGGGTALLLAPVLIFAGLQMRQLRSYSVALMASILSAVPCLSCSGCFLFGQVAGIWALVVLIDPTVRMAFSAASLPSGMYPLPNPQQTPQQPTPQQPTNPTPENPTPENPTDNIQPGGQP